MEWQYRWHSALLIHVTSLEMHLYLKLLYFDTSVKINNEARNRFEKDTIIQEERNKLHKVVLLKQALWLKKIRFSKYIILL